MVEACEYNDYDKKANNVRKTSVTQKKKKFKADIRTRNDEQDPTITAEKP